MASISRSDALVMSTPLMWTCPEDGFSRPTSVRSRVLLPEPEPPITTAVSPWTMSKVRPCSTSRSPYCTRRSRTEMTGMGAGAVGEVISGGSPCQVEQRSEEQIDQDDQKDGDDHGRGGGASHFFGAGPGGETLLAANRGDDQAKHQRFNDAGGNVVRDQRVSGGNHVAAECEVAAHDSEYAAAQYAHEVRPGGEARHHHGHGQEFRHHQKCNRIERHSLEGVQLFGYAHRADLRGECRAGSSDDYDGGNQRAEFAGDGDGYQAGHQLHGSQ